MDGDNRVLEVGHDGQGCAAGAEYFLVGDLAGRFSIRGAGGQGGGQRGDSDHILSLRPNQPRRAESGR
jgi:hypothetical protein